MNSLCFHKAYTVKYMYIVMKSDNRGYLNIELLVITDV